MFPSAGKLAVLKLLVRAQIQLERLSEALEAKAEEFDDVLKMGRTQMQDAVPIRLGQEFRAYSWVVRRDIARFERAKDEMRRLNMGAPPSAPASTPTSGICAASSPTCPRSPGLSWCRPPTSSTPPRTWTGSWPCPARLRPAPSTCPRCPTTCGSCPPAPLRLQRDQPAAPAERLLHHAGKVNPVIPEVVSQVAFNIIGNDVTVTMAAEAGQLELNAFEPIIFYNLIQSVETLTYAVHTFVDNCVTGITANRERCRDMVEHSVGIITALCPHVGYEKAAEVAKRAIETGAPVRRLILEEGLLDEAALDKILDPYSMTEPGISGKELLEG